MCQNVVVVRSIRVCWITFEIVDVQFRYAATTVLNTCRRQGFSSKQLHELKRLQGTRLKPLILKKLLVLLKPKAQTTSISRQEKNGFGRY